MTFRRKRSDTHIGTIESQYGINLNARSDMKLRTLLKRRKFETLTSLVRAYHGNQKKPAQNRYIFLSFYNSHRYRKGWVKWLTKKTGYSIIPNLKIHSTNEEYIHSILRERIKRCSVVLCLIGYGTYDRRWVNWELEEALRQKRGICGIRIRNKRDAAGRRPRPAKKPRIFEILDLPIVDYPTSEKQRVNLIRAIEQAAARGNRYRSHDFH